MAQQTQLLAELRSIHARIEAGRAQGLCEPRRVFTAEDRLKFNYSTLQSFEVQERDTCVLTSCNASASHIYWLSKRAGCLDAQTHVRTQHYSHLSFSRLFRLLSFIATKSTVAELHDCRDRGIEAEN